MRMLWSRLVRDRRGATAIEYGLMAGLIALALVGVVAACGDAMGLKFEFLGATMNKAG